MLIYPVLQLTLPTFIATANVWSRPSARFDYGKEKIRLVVGSFSRREETSGWTDLTRALGHAVAHVVPNQFGDVAASGQPGRADPQAVPASPVTRAALEIAATLAPVAAKKHGSWLSRLMRRG